MAEKKKKKEREREKERKTTRSRVFLLVFLSNGNKNIYKQKRQWKKESLLKLWDSPPPRRKEELDKGL